MTPPPPQGGKGASCRPCRIPASASNRAGKSPPTYFSVVTLARHLRDYSPAVPNSHQRSRGPSNGRPAVQPGRQSPHHRRSPEEATEPLHFPLLALTRLSTDARGRSESFRDEELTWGANQTSAREGKISPRNCNGCPTRPFGLYARGCVASEHDFEARCPLVLGLEASPRRGVQRAPRVMDEPGQHHH